MLTFLAIYFMCIFTSACVTYVLYEAIQEGEALGAWQKVLAKLYAKGLYNTEKFLGGCYKCFSHLIGILSFAVYVFINESLFNSGYGGWYVLIYIMFVPMCIALSMVIKGIIKQLNKD